MNSNVKLTTKSIVVAITLKDSSWKRKEPCGEDKLVNKFIEMDFKSNSIKENLGIISFQKTTDPIKEKINGNFKAKDKDIILGDFNETGWISELHEKKELGYRDIITNDMITYKPGQTAIDRIFVKKGKFDDKIVFNGIIETFLSDHNLLTFSLNI